MKEKFCPKCLQQKQITDYNKNKNKKSGYHNICRECMKIISKRHYREDKQKHIGLVKKNQAKYIKRNQEFIINYLLKNPCILCGEKDILVLEFDHQENKEYNLCYMTRNHSIEMIKNEISKCQVLCRHCHIRKTRKDQNDYRWQWYIANLSGS